MNFKTRSEGRQAAGGGADRDDREDVMAAGRGGFGL